MVDVILNQLALGVRDRLLDRMELLGEVNAGAARLDHLDDGGEMAIGLLPVLWTPRLGVS